MKVCIGHKSAMTNKKLAIQQREDIRTPKRAKPSSDSSRFLIINLPTSYNNNLLYFKSTHETEFVSVPGKKRKEFRSWSIAQDVSGQISSDMYHKEKRREMKGISLCLHACTAYDNA